MILLSIRPESNQQLICYISRCGHPHNIAIHFPPFLYLIFFVSANFKMINKRLSNEFELNYVLKMELKVSICRKCYQCRQVLTKTKVYNCYGRFQETMSFSVHKEVNAHGFFRIRWCRASGNSFKRPDNQ